MSWSFIGTSLSALPAFVAYFVTALVLVAAFLAIYTRLTPHHEWTLIRAGNVAASLSLGGALLGFSLPLASVIAHSSVLIDVVIWGVVALLVQLLLWWVVDKAMADLTVRVEKGDVASGLFLATTSLAAGIINTACMTY